MSNFTDIKTPQQNSLRCLLLLIEFQSYCIKIPNIKMKFYQTVFLYICVMFQCISGFSFANSRIFSSSGESMSYSINSSLKLQSSRKK